MQEKPDELRQKFNAFDADGSASLDSNELHKMLSALVPGVTPNESLYFASMADVDGDGEVAYEELLSCLRECCDLRNAAKFTRDVRPIPPLPAAGAAAVPWCFAPLPDDRCPGSPGRAADGRDPWIRRRAPPVPEGAVQDV